tara:strand:+ start:40077 stop:40316 length:240 start_codon:yes stop_codon:yes gene_type:complete
MDQLAYVLPPAVISALIQIGLALLAFLLSRWMLKRLDLRIDFNFKEWISNADDNAVSNYLGYRILAVCILVGLIVSGSL